MLKKGSGLLGLAQEGGAPEAFASGQGSKDG